MSTDNLTSNLVIAKATRNFEIRNVLTGHCGKLLTPSRVDEIVAEISIAMEEGPCAWAFRGNQQTI